MLRRTAATATDVACLAVGRRQVVRAARFVLYRARLDIPNDLRTNGESSLQRWMLELSQPGRKMNILDVGANVGRWSSSMLATARQLGRSDDLRLHSFEPSSYTFALLSQALDGQPAVLNRIALGERSGSAILNVLAPGAGTNSLYESTTAHTKSATEEVTTTTLDGYVERAGLGCIALVKIDTEGHDLSVLRGGRKLFAEQRILVAQFEYNHRWIAARSFLRDAFELLVPLGYRLAKLTPNGLEFYPAWDAELETFVEGNYVACLPEVAERLPFISWWKSTSTWVTQ
jgi:FkbM family methyltransferase